MVGVILVGVGTLVAGVAFQRFLVRQLAKEHREVKERFGNYFDTDIFSSEHSIATFIESNYPAFPMSGKQVLWALSEDCQPYAIAYDTSQMLVCKVELRNGKIHQHTQSHLQGQQSRNPQLNPLTRLQSDDEGSHPDKHRLCDILLQRQSISNRKIIIYRYRIVTCRGCCSL